MSQAARYQPEIDGLRAVAIVATVLFHARFPGLDGGYVGVDVFFVISGFLITRLLLDDLHTRGRIDYLAFYARRVRRILPALLTVVAGVLLAAIVLMSAAVERPLLSQSALATVGFVSNIFFWQQQATYFGVPSDRLALLNMWTLSVEEQFYLVWPLFLALAFAAARRLRLPVVKAVGIALGVLIVVSLALLLLMQRRYGTAAFYLMPTRLWELALGGALALAEPSLHRMKRWGALAAAIGLGVILLSVTSMSRWVPFGFAIIPPVLASAAIIAGVSSNPQSPVGRLLASAPLVRIGKLSYSWYLWHWPVLCMVRLADIVHPSRVRDLAVVIATIGLAALTYRFVEDPIRRAKPWPFATARQALAAGGMLSVLVAALAAVLWLEADARAKRDPWPAAIVQAHKARSLAARECRNTRWFKGLAPQEACRIGEGSGPPKILLWGDSNAEHLHDLLQADATRAGYAAIIRTMSACVPLLPPPGVQIRQMSSDCRDFNEAVAAEIPKLAGHGLTGIVLASRNFGFVVNAAPQERAAWLSALRRVLDVAAAHRLRIVVVGPVPNYPYRVPECLAHRGPDGCDVDRSFVDKLRAPLVASLNELIAGRSDARLLDLSIPLCNAQVCWPMRDGIILYNDGSHLTQQGSRVLAPFAAPALDWLRSR